MTELFPMQLAGDDALCVIRAVNQGIDSRLTGFTQSEFGWQVHCISGNTYSEMDYLGNGLPEGETAITAKLHCVIHPSEMEILLRRLDELSETDDPLAEEAEMLLRDIIEIEYDVEIYS